jgi:hypothetical protein
MLKFSMLKATTLLNMYLIIIIKCVTSYLTNILTVYKLFFLPSHFMIKLESKYLNNLQFQ